MFTVKSEIKQELLFHMLSAIGLINYRSNTNEEYGWTESIIHGIDAELKKMFPDHNLIFRGFQLYEDNKPSDYTLRITISIEDNKVWYVVTAEYSAIITERNPDDYTATKVFRDRI